jgi:hypothetical protein
VCRQLVAGELGNKFTRWNAWYKLARLVESLPF